MTLNATLDEGAGASDITTLAGQTVSMAGVVDTVDTVLGEVNGRLATALKALDQSNRSLIAEQQRSNRRLQELLGTTREAEERWRQEARRALDLDCALRRQEDSRNREARQAGSKIQRLEHRLQDTQQALKRVSIHRRQSEVAAAAARAGGGGGGGGGGGAAGAASGVAGAGGAGGGGWGWKSGDAAATETLKGVSNALAESLVTAQVRSLPPCYQLALTSQ